MFCPGCGQQPTSDGIRHCTHCGFALNKLTDFLSDEAPAKARQFDISLGAGLMLLGTIKALLIMFALGRPLPDALPLAEFALGLIFGLLQLFFHLSPRQKGLSLGATLMFLSALAALAALSLFGAIGALAIAAVAIPLILTWHRLVRIFNRLFFEKKDRLPAQAQAALEPAQSLPQVEIDTQKVKPTAVAQPRSVTENTTGLLEK